MIRLTEIAAHITQQVRRLDTILLERLIGHAKKRRKRVAQRRLLYLEFVGQHRFEFDILAPCGALCQLQLFSRNDRVGNQRFILAPHLHARTLTLPKGNRQRLAQMQHTIFHILREGEGLAALGIDNLDNADQVF